MKKSIETIIIILVYLGTLLGSLGILCFITWSLYFIISGTDIKFLLFLTFVLCGTSSSITVVFYCLKRN